jgi:uncharacterized alkaline shock family protein YloU
MSDVNKIDLGSIKVHKKVLAEIAMSAVNDVNGVSLSRKHFSGLLGSLMKNRDYSGITVIVDKNNQVSVEVKVNVLYGLNIPDVARETQDAIREAIERTVDIDLKDVNVNIQGIERGE